MRCQPSSKLLIVIEFRVPSEDDHPAMVRQLREGFGGDEYTDEAAAREKPLLDFDRFRVAYDTAQRRIVGTSGTWELELTLPGLARLPMAGLTWVAVSPVHRRQGVFRGMLDAIHADVAARGEPLAGLLASEGTIYERFGYAVATTQRIARVDRRMVALDERFSAPGGGVRLLPGNDPAIVDALAPRWERYRRRTVGELSRTEAWHGALAAESGWDATYALHDGGYAAWKIKPDWAPAPPHHELTVREFVASTPEARDALWSTILAMDLVGPVVVRSLPVDASLPYQLTNPRAVATEGLVDMLWLKVLDVSRVFGARTYGADDEMVFEVDGARWTVGNGGCSRTRKRPDFVVDPTVLGALVLGGVSLHMLAAARRLSARSDAALARANLLFRTFPEPHCQTHF